VGQGKNPCQKVNFISTPAHSVCGGRCPGGQGGTGWKFLPESGFYKHPCALRLWREVPRWGGWDRVKILVRKEIIKSSFPVLATYQGVFSLTLEIFW